MRASAKKWLVITFGIAGAVAIAVYIWRSQRPTLPPEFTSANGRLEATQVDIAPRIAGRLRQILVREGDLVEKDEVVARMDTRSLEANLRKAQAELQEDIEAKNTAEAKVAQQKSDVEFATAEYQRNEALVKRKLVPQQQADFARTKLHSSQAALKAAQASATQAEASIEAARAHVASINVDLEDSILKSPVLGRVLYRVAEPGEILPVGGKILTIVDLSDVYMTVFLPAKDVGKVRIGADVRIVFDARPDLAVPARVTFVSPEAQFTPKAVETHTEREKLMFRVKAQIAPELLKQHIALVKTGVPGVVYFRLNPQAQWPKNLQPPPGI